MICKMCDILGKFTTTKTALHHHLLNCDMLLGQLSLLDKLHNDSKLPEVLCTVFFPPVILALRPISWVLVSLCLLMNLIQKNSK